MFGSQAYSQGTDVHLGPGQDRLLAHEISRGEVAPLTGAPGESLVLDTFVAAVQVDENDEAVSGWMAEHSRAETSSGNAETLFRGTLRRSDD